MDMKLEVSMVPVSDVDRAKRFYQNLGFRLDIDYVANPNYRLIRFTPPGSEASIIIGKGITSARPGLIDGLAGGFHDGTEARAPGPDPQGRSYGSYASFRDPDGSGWLLQEIRERLPGRATQPSLNGDMTPLLLEMLKSAAGAHGVNEKELGQPDPGWPQWYAEHMARTLSGAGYHITGPSAQSGEQG